MRYRDLITLAKFKAMGFKNIELKYIPEIKLNRIICELDIKVGKATYTLPFEAFCNTATKIVIARHMLFEEVVKMLEEFNAKEYKEKLSHLERLGAK